MGTARVESRSMVQIPAVPVRYPCEACLYFSFEEKNMKNLIFCVFSMFFAYTMGPVSLEIPQKLRGCSLERFEQLPSLHEDDPITIQSARN